MSATELDLPLLPSAEQIRRREFATIRRGYDPEQVRDVDGVAYLSVIAATRTSVMTCSTWLDAMSNV